ncbi:hypothetical protein [Lactobacillus taiwanensis]|uniref:hypothetical protein n=1 Tax=Lactobacillus taiwanensis TaxID=508451 RepID=UPI00214B5DD4|nr:hypothetical protein [Lactobacillus taiwanensis]MCR1904181.1 hypothetical protein [Lactobacillus taiwanensis]
MKLSNNVTLAGGALLAASAGAATTLVTPSLNITAHADVNPYGDIQGDQALDTNTNQHISKAFEYMNPDEAAASWKHKEDWEKEPGTDNTQTDWAIAQNTNGKTSSNTSASVYGDSSEARFNPGDKDNNKMTSLGWTENGSDDSTIIYYGDNGSTLIIDNNNNNNNNNNNGNNSNNSNNLRNNQNATKTTNGTNVGTVGKAGNGTPSTTTKQIGQNIEGNVGNNLGVQLKDGKYLFNGKAAQLEKLSNGTLVVRTADGRTIIVDNNNNNNNNNNGNNSNNSNNLNNGQNGTKTGGANTGSTGQTENGTPSNNVEQIGQNIKGNSDNNLGLQLKDGQYYYNGQKVSEVEDKGNGTFVVKTADGHTIIVDNNNNNNNNNNNGNNDNNNNDNTGNSSVVDNDPSKTTANNSTASATIDSKDKNSKDTPNSATTDPAANDKKTGTVAAVSTSGSGNAKTTPVSTTVGSVSSTPVSISSNATLPQTGDSNGVQVASTVAGIVVTSMAALGLKAKKFQN